MPGPKPIPLDVLIEHGRREEPNGCHSFHGRTHGRQPAVGAKGRRVLASRIILDIEDRPDLVARHTCDHNWCINPDHLLAGTQRDNILDAIEHGRLDMTQINHWETRDRDERGRFR